MENKLAVLIPAHNEEDQLSATLEGLRRQTVAPDRVIVVADNCTDRTVELARSGGAEVFETVGNAAKKAGALNQVLAEILPSLSASDLVLVQDADSALDPGFIAGALKALDADSRLGAVGGTFRGSDDGGFVGMLQRNEYSRYERDVNRLDGKCLVVTGTAAMFRAGTLRHVVEARRTGESGVPVSNGGVYDVEVLTEDSELSLALLHLGYKILCPAECTLVTEVMGSWADLWKQRLRWKRGALENCAQYGMTGVTWRYWGRQVLSLIGVLVTVVYLASLVYGAFAGMELHPVWLWISGVFVIERVVTVKGRGWKHMLAAATMYEIVYDMFLQATHAWAFTSAALRLQKEW